MVLRGTHNQIVTALLLLGSSSPLACASPLLGARAPFPRRIEANPPVIWLIEVRRRWLRWELLVVEEVLLDQFAPGTQQLGPGNAQGVHPAEGAEVTPTACPSQLEQVLEHIGLCGTHPTLEQRLSHLWRSGCANGQQRGRSGCTQFNEVSE